MKERSSVPRLLAEDAVIKAVDEHTFNTPNGLFLDDDITCILAGIPGIEPERPPTPLMKEGTSNLIGRQAVIDELRAWRSSCLEIGHMEAAAAIKLIINAFEKLPPPKGRPPVWKEADIFEEGRFVAIPYCPGCGDEIFESNAYCPSCGQAIDWCGGSGADDEPAGRPGEVKP